MFLIQTRQAFIRKPCIRWLSSLNTQFQIKPKLDYAYISSNKAVFEQNMLNRKYNKIDMDQFAVLYQKRLDIYNQLKELNAERNKLSMAVKTAKGQEKQDLIERGKRIKIKAKAYEDDLKEIETELLTKGLMIPNTTHPDVPIGPEENARVLKTVGTPRTGNNLKDHLQITADLNLLDLEQAAVTSGSSFYYLQGMGAFLELALINYAMHKAVSKGFFGVLTPDIVRTSVAYGCGFQPRSDENSQIYHIQSNNGSQLCLAGTAEIPLAGKFAEKTFKEAQLPQKLVGFGHAFRTEDGGRGVEPKGLYRVHQFSKVEFFAVTTAEQSEEMMEEIRSIQEDIFSELGLCFRVLDMPTEELGASAYRKYDIEAWMPGRNSWGEISSTSNCTDYQSRRLGIRYRKAHNENQQLFCHTLNGTAMAVPRVIIAILETFQQDDGTVRIPRVLRKWLPGEPEYIR
ncbi:serine-tRNA ligase [Rhizopus microsporus ATCC 52813]|uniref:serine--tRNA ligase n=1 Tax=Rhizopus microsporus ATCC 52813 TaxID=1340429 RepID=A0A2G4T9V5_RHIZD|nr:serine-tRNA ligase [Rhizopus microsporus ATCC 52813]PHZ17775.1 serine-tRNA ligase [Rhizopus microsporus ATCC 52813]